MDLEGLWEHAKGHLLRRYREGEAMLEQWRRETPERMGDRDLLREYGWVVATCGLTARAIEPRWEALGSALGGWDPEAALRAGPEPALAVLRNRRKVEAILWLARVLAESPGIMGTLAREDALAPVLDRFRQWPFIGATNAFHLARNLGWDTVARSGPVVRLAEFFGYDVEELCDEIGLLAGERRREVDLVLWRWGVDVGDQAMLRWADLYRSLTPAG